MTANNNNLMSMSKGNDHSHNDDRSRSESFVKNQSDYGSEDEEGEDASEEMSS